MKVIILCAGLGSRLNSKKPKCFLEVNGKPIINYIVENLIKNGFKKKDIIFATGFKNQLIKKKFGKNYSYILIDTIDQLIWFILCSIVLKKLKIKI